ncbi:DivIVA domain-containing protein [Quadrisphaera granulorum]|uniref:Cell wall synthesis protein Wag31 n=1 Tax=Quadrisphaera granulorum TaxID=317664 RepID=A0A316ATY3_9ACTN|nr:DivIVA domain-containing protein [Quadrisphaera granulorum]PWJ53667.1 DivIVA domain-containing protein [Quadrisphaera granulorum]SZE96711.1 DivIVA domain-containing protein [Quadrisphaera granulorum]
MALTPEDVVNKRFQPTKFREGYDQDEVDDFLDEVVGELRRLTAENEQLQQSLSACERRVTELSRSGGTTGQVPQQVAPAPQPIAPAPAPVSPVGQPLESATGMLALAQKLHDDFVRSGEEQRDAILSEAKDRAARLVREAEDKHRQTLGSLEQERSLLERKIDELRNFERDYRNRMKSYLESQLRDLETRSSAGVAGSNGGRPSPSSAQDVGYAFGGGAN